LVVCLYAVAVTQTLSAILALVLGAVVFWFRLIPTRRFVAATTVTAFVGGLLALALPPLRERLLSKAHFLAQGKIDEVLTGRLDGWKAAGWMLGQEPLSGVGLGAYRAEFATAKLALVAKGVDFFRGQHQVMFINAHNEYLEVAAELGWPGLLALAWALWVLWRALRRREARAAGGEGTPATFKERGDGALAWAGAGALAVAALAQFPFRLALVAFPALVFLAWVFASGASEENS